MTTTKDGISKENLRDFEEGYIERYLAFVQKEVDRMIKEGFPEAVLNDEQKRSARIYFQGRIMNELDDRIQKRLKDRILKMLHK